MIYPSRGVIEGIQVSPNGGVPKRPVDYAVITRGGIAGDRQANPGIHGGPDKALCLYSMDLIEQLRGEGHPIQPGTAGENLTVRGLDWSGVTPGKQYRLGSSALIEITDYTTPCVTIQGSFRDGDITRILHTKRPGQSRVYARVLREGKIALGDVIQEVPER